ncbi:hypothetical protein [Amycolatopsis sp. NPDC051071]|uniref:hypothetical protein n=1 Tax=Amycolatopsis sp. NPDC051071 TaxID=3154637 RepID=UPI00344A76F1
MTVQLNHTIINATDRTATAGFLVSILGLPEPAEFGPFRGQVQAADRQPVPLVDHDHVHRGVVDLRLLQEPGDLRRCPVGRPPRPGRVGAFPRCRCLHRVQLRDPPQHRAL